MSPLQPIGGRRHRSRDEVATDYLAELREEYAIGNITLEQLERATDDVLRPGSRPRPIKPAMPTYRCSP